MQRKNACYHIKEIRRQTHRAKVERSSKSCVLRILRETGLTLTQLEKWLRQRGLNRVT